MQANLDGVVKAMAMPAASFGENLDRNLKINEPAESKSLATDMAYNFVSEVGAKLNRDTGTLYAFANFFNAAQKL